MQNYVDLAEKNRISLLSNGTCQFCGAETKRGVHECLEIFNLGFQEIDFSDAENHIYRFLTVDAHTLQHPEIHGRWNNHFHLSRLHLILTYKVRWTYKLSSRFSDHLKKYKKSNQDEYLIPPKVLERGNITITDIQKKSSINQTECKKLIHQWAQEVYQAWNDSQSVVDKISKGFNS